MKTTVDLDDKKLRRVMELTGIKTRKQVIDFALTEAERLARIRKVFEKPFYLDPAGEVVDPGYDVVNLRQKEEPPDDPH